MTLWIQINNNVGMHVCVHEYVRIACIYRYCEPPDLGNDQEKECIVEVCRVASSRDMYRHMQ